MTQGLYFDICVRFWCTREKGGRHVWDLRFQLHYSFIFLYCWAYQDILQLNICNFFFAISCSNSIETNLRRVVMVEKNKITLRYLWKKNNNLCVVCLGWRGIILVLRRRWVVITCKVEIENAEEKIKKKRTTWRSGDFLWEN